MLYAAGIPRARAARRNAAALGKVGDAPLKRRRLHGKQPEHAAVANCRVILKGSWAAWPSDEVDDFRLSVAAVGELVSQCGCYCSKSALRGVQGLAMQMPPSIANSTRTLRKWSKILSAPGGRGPGAGRVPRHVAALVLQDLQDVANEAFGWHAGRIVGTATMALRRSADLLSQGDWKRALSVMDSLIEPLDEIGHFEMLEWVIKRLASVHLGLLEYGDADECANYLLNHESPCVRRWHCHGARSIKARVDRERRRGLHRGTLVRLCHHGPLNNSVGTVRGRPGAERGSYHRGNDADVYEVSVGGTAHRVDVDCLTPVRLVVQTSFRDGPDEKVVVVGTSIGGGQCAQFSMEPWELMQPASRLVARIALATGHHASNIECVLPDGLVASHRSAGDRARGPPAIRSHRSCT